MARSLRSTIGKAALILTIAISFAVICISEFGDASFAFQQNQENPRSSRFAPGRILVKFRPDADADNIQQLMDEFGVLTEGEISQIGVRMLRLPPGAAEVILARMLEQDVDIEFAELDYLRAPDLIPNDPLYSSQYHLAKIAAPAAWNSTPGISSVVIAILDTGVDPAHADLIANMVEGWNFFDNNNNTSDVYGHGTAVAGTAAAAGNNALGVASVAWGCRIMPVRISGPDGYAYDSTIASGLTWAADRGARVANISYAVTGSSTVTNAAKYFVGKGGAVTVSAGNNGTFSASADNPYVLTVSATTSSDALASWSNTGNNIDLAAPGDYIYTTTRGGGYGAWAGTSFSAPIVAGVAALAISANPALSGNQVMDILKQSATDLGAAGWDPSYGWGRINAATAVQTALDTIGNSADTVPPTVEISSPSAGATVSGTVSIEVSAIDNTSVTSVSLSIDGVKTGTDTSYPYSFSWNTTSYSNGQHTITATASDAAGNSATHSHTVTVSNALDVIPPTISITSPLNGATVPKTTVSVKVSASDNVGVTKVELYVDGALTSTSTTPPFTTKWNARKASSGAHTLACKAYDAAGNSNTSSIVVTIK